jgi:hypothetical protein
MVSIESAPEVKAQKPVKFDGISAAEAAAAMTAARIATSLSIPSMLPVYNWAQKAK